MLEVFCSKKRVHNIPKEQVFPENIKKKNLANSYAYAWLSIHFSGYWLCVNYVFQVLLK